MCKSHSKAAAIVALIILQIVPTAAFAVDRRGGRGVRSNANANINHNVNANRNVNINSNRNVNVNVHNDYHHDYHNDWDDHYHPVARAAAVGATVAVTAAVVGSVVRSVPPSCSTVIVSGISYSQCGSTWYAPRYSGTTVEYVVVNPPR